MTTAAMELRLDTILNELQDADQSGERREFMNAILRVSAMICAESPHPEESLGRAIEIIKATFMEQYEEQPKEH